MSAAKKKSAPGLVSMLFAAALSVVLGGLIAAISLVARPVEVVRSAPKEPVEGKVYFIQGESARSASSSWEAKGRAIIAGESGEYVFNESELNAWASARFEHGQAPDGTPLAVVAGVPNFRVDGQSLQIGMVNRLTTLAGEAPLVAQVRGRFERGAAGWTYVPDEAWLGGLALHKIPGLLPAVMARFVGSGEAADEVRGVLGKALAVALVEGGLVVAMP